MTPWLRTLGLGTGGLLLVLGTAPAPVSYASSAPSAPSALMVAPPAASYAVDPLPAESRAGSGAGVGRQRPGRQAVPGEEAPGIRTEMDPGVPEVPDIPVGPETGVDADVGADVGPEPSRHAAPSSSSSEPVWRVFSLGSGLVLIGLGLGLAFLGLRVRRG
ncbi:hypothetical protein [Streptomyces ureilyticus]|uniref:Uncharacterized protein n=1 Tax=Streptomyces ureilyticus TaxID=1775131 RepID=A0ABX0DNE2_9ACTN|nr:hypothetical protein [Streptomyces ureilyticus]NGO42254.1 hypothetical protein [Streptomyces ureilyticus]